MSKDKMYDPYQGFKQISEMWAGIVNIPTKKDVANVVNLSIQAEGKIDILEEQMLKIQENLGALNKDDLVLFQAMVKMVKQIQVEFQKTAHEVTELKRMKNDFQELWKDLVDIKIIQVNLRDVRQELEEIKEAQKKIMKMNNLNEQKTIYSDLEEVKLKLNQLAEIKNEIAPIKGLVVKDSSKGKTKEKELVTTV
ncbi:hypothetical protein QFZ31_002808 [Neobacillus niacini]|uniref:hypothetical protein n=1 Tax=Neobacillus driksii TaxID=3035913 RepID=UPI00278A2679|nr:hypothetical protein [Neobacillus niacini]MDQ0972930.1 hypothetical protein [Neobacillus niacini]